MVNGDRRNIEKQKPPAFRGAGEFINLDAVKKGKAKVNGEIINQSKIWYSFPAIKGL